MLSSINLPNSITSIGMNAFAYNNLSGTLTIPASVTSIGIGAFQGTDYSSNNVNDNPTNNITTLNFESGSLLETISDQAFRGSRLRNIDFSNATHLKTIGEGSFSHNTTQGIIYFPSSLEIIKDSAFWSTLSIEEFHLGSNIKKMGDNCLNTNNYDNLRGIYIDMTEATWNSTVTDMNGGPITAYGWRDSNVPVNFNQS